MPITVRLLKSGEKSTNLEKFLSNCGLTCVGKQDLQYTILDVTGLKNCEEISSLLTPGIFQRTIAINTGEDLAEPIFNRLINLGIQYYQISSPNNEHHMTILNRVKRWQAIDETIEEIRGENQLIGDSPAWMTFLRSLVEVSLFSNCGVLIEGETGTGKELAAKLIHRLDKRKGKKDLVLLDCTTLVPELVGSELYGHEKGSFTNASYTREGSFALANFGTLFLDEIGEMPLSLQSGLLRAIQEGSYKRVGSNEWRKTFFRLVCATNRDLKKEVSEKRFREDLYYRINTVVLHVPPLRERREDILRLANYFLQKEITGLEIVPEFDEVVSRFLITRNYDGNVRELKQLISCIAYRFTGGSLITLNDLPPDELKKIMGDSKQVSAEEFESFLFHAIANGGNLQKIKNTIGEISMKVAMEITGNNAREAAKLLGIDIRTIQLYRQRNKVKSNGHASHLN